MKRICRLYSTVLLSVSLAVSVGCGKKGPLLYPDQLIPAPVSGLVAVQSGTNAKVSFTLPDKDLAGRSLRDLSGVRMYRRAAPLSSSPDPACGVCREGYQLFKTLYLDAVDDAQMFGRTLILLDRDISPNNRYSYFAVAFTRDGSAGSESAQVSMTALEPVQPPAVRVYAEPTDIVLEMTGPVTRAGTLAGYLVYRAAKGYDIPLAPVNQVPVVDGARYRDSGLGRATDYRYVVRALVRRPDGSLQESLPSDEVHARLRDDVE